MLSIFFTRNIKFTRISVNYGETRAWLENLTALSQLGGGDIDNMWVPDPFCYNARESNLMLPNEEVHSLVHIQPDGDVLMSKG